MTATKTATEVKVTLNRTELSRKLDFVGLATEKKNTIPILATVKLSLTGKLLKMVATNLDIAAEVSMQCVSDATAELCVDFKKLSALVKQKPGEEVELVFSGTKLGINAGRSKSTLSGVDVAGFPEVERKENEGESIALPAAVMCEALKATAWASSADESRYTLSCVQMTITPDSLRCEATDSKALAIATAPIVAPGKDVKVTIPVSSIPSILGVLAESKTEAFVTLSDKSLLIESGVYSISTRLLAGQFPAVEMIENSKFAEVCTVNVDELSAAIGRLMVMGQESKVDKANPISFNVSNDCLALSVPSSEIGDGNECVSADMVGTINGKLNGKFVKEGIAPCQSRMIEVASVEGADCTNAFRVKSSWPIAENAKLDYTFIVAGMRL
jgi:DNA polymerase-3 subunit beta